MIYVFAKAGAYYNRIDVKGDYPRAMATNPKRTITGQILPNKLQDNTNKRCCLSIISKTGYESRSKGQHPTEKPMELYKFLIERYCPVNGTMLDPTAGSFNSCFAAMDLNRHAIGIEKDEEFYKKACERADAL
jgi:site-specific DNA-methyltransferase (adenine-specific)